MGTRWRVTGGMQDPGLVERLLGSLPEWFGIEEANAAYVQAARELPGYSVAAHGGDAVGVLLVKRHFPVAAEIYLLAVGRSWHRQGAGRALVAALETGLRAEGVQFLQVKTLGPSHPDKAYAQTRQFYTSVGFAPLEELPGLWPGNPCLIMIKPLPPPHPPRP